VNKSSSRIFFVSEQVKLAFTSCLLIWIWYCEERFLLLLWTVSVFKAQRDWSMADRDGQPLFIYRVLRPDQEVGPLVPKYPLEAGEELTPEVVEAEVVNGGRFLPFTAERSVVLAFGGCFSRIAQVDERHLEPAQVAHLDSDWLRKFTLTTDTARSRSRRSDEVIVAQEVPSYKIVKVTITNTLRKLMPRCGNDADYFPTEAALLAAFNAEDRSALDIARYSTANKRLFRVTIGGRNYIAHPPRPNYSLDHDLLTDDKLVALANHEFACFMSYRTLQPKHSPRCALYELELQTDFPKSPPGHTTKWALILLEELNFLDDEGDEVLEQVREAANALLPADVLLGNWHCTGDTKSIRDLAKESEGLYARNMDGEIVRAAVDRALGCVYPEDVEGASPKYTSVLPFSDDCKLLLQSLLDNNEWLFRRPSADWWSLPSAFLATRLYDPTVAERLCDDLQAMDACWPEVLGSNHLQCVHGEHYTESTNATHMSLQKLLMRRCESIAAQLPYRILPMCGRGPVGRDGHAMIALPRQGLGQFIIMGGNSADGALSDCWQFDRKTLTWSQLPSMPGGGRYSFTAALVEDRYIVVFGGWAGEKEYFNDILVLDVLHLQGPTWLENVQQTGERPGGRCRHAAVLFPAVEREGNTLTAKLAVVGGFGVRRKGLWDKLKDMWEGLITITEQAFPSGAPGAGAVGTAAVTVGVQWQCRGDAESAVHRHFIFSMEGDKRLLLLGGFGQIFSRLNVLQDGSPPSPPSPGAPNSTPVAKKRVIIAKVRAVLKNGRGDSRSYAGFAAVLDHTESRVLLMGGASSARPGQTDAGTGRGGRGGGRGRCGGRGRGGTGTDTVAGTLGGFGSRPAIGKPLTMIVLKRTLTDGGEFWTLEPFKPLELPEEHCLPAMTSWTACLLNHEVLLFGGRSGEAFSSALYAIRLRPDRATRLDLIRILAARLEELVIGASDPAEALAVAREALPCFGAQAAN